MQSAVKTNESIVVLGSCSIDFTTYAARLPKPGETIQGIKFTTSYGGKGANQCVAAAKLGAKPYMICRLGDDDWGHKYKEHLKSNGVEMSHVHLSPNETTGVAQITVAENGDNQIVIVPGANCSLGVSDVEAAKEIIQNASILIGQLETPFKATLEAFKLNKGIKLLNAAPAKKEITEILPYCTILCVNETEASLMTNLIVTDLSTAISALQSLLKMGCGTVIITLGQNGAIYRKKGDNDPIHVFCDKIIPVDTTGAGDAFVGALAVFLLSYKQLPFHQVVGAACHIASISVTKEGTQQSYPLKCDTIFNKEFKYELIKYTH